MSSQLWRGRGRGGSRDGRVPGEGQAQRGARGVVDAKVEQEATHCRGGKQGGGKGERDKRDEHRPGHQRASGP